MQVLAESYEHKDTLWNDYECPKFIPFNPVDKYTIAIIRDLKTGEMMRIMKGAPQVSFACLLAVICWKVGISHATFILALCHMGHSQQVKSILFLMGQTLLL